MTSRHSDTITTIDGHYMYPRRAAAYLIQDGEEAAFFDTCTRFSVPHLLEALKTNGGAPEQVRYILVSHIHLDHSGGVGELIKHCPNAVVIAHPRAERHIVDPSRLVASARPIYGDAFDELYGEIEAVEASRVRAAEDGETLALGKRTLTVMHTPGHAPHHYIMLDSAENALFTGDTFGFSHPVLREGTRPYLGYICAPPAFDPQQAKKSLVRIADTGAECAYVTHFGPFAAVKDGAALNLDNVDRYDALATEAAHSGRQGQDLADFCHAGSLRIIQEGLRACGLDPGDEEVHFWSTTELPVTAQGIAVLAEQRRE